MYINSSQIDDLADHFVTIIDSVAEYFKDPINQEAYIKWYQQKYGTKPYIEGEVWKIIESDNGF